MIKCEPRPPLTFNPPILAHRGASAYAPENTLIAFMIAQDLGARWLEFDVWLTACGEVVVFHDESLERTTNGSGLVYEQPYRYLKTLDAGSWFAHRFSGERIPRFVDVLAFLGESRLAANVEIKSRPGNEKETVTQVLKQVAGCKNLPQLFFSSFSIAVLSELRWQAPDCQLGFLMDEVRPEWRQVALDLQASLLSVNEALLTPEILTSLKKAALPILAYTVNNHKRASELYAMGVSALFTDCPDQILSIFNKVVLDAAYRSSHLIKS